MSVLYFFASMCLLLAVQLSTFIVEVSDYFFLPDAEIIELQFPNELVVLPCI